MLNYSTTSHYSICYAVQELYANHTKMNICFLSVRQMS